MFLINNEKYKSLKNSWKFGYLKNIIRNKGLHMSDIIEIFIESEAETFLNKFLNKCNLFYWHLIAKFLASKELQHNLLQIHQYQNWHWKSNKESLISCRHCNLKFEQINVVDMPCISFSIIAYYSIARCIVHYVSQAWLSPKTRKM